jgi:membrane associated rhomboid family serine protease
MSSNIMILSYGKIVFFPIILPLLISFLHFQYKCTQKGFVYVSAEASELAGIYQLSGTGSGARLYRQKAIEWDSGVIFEPDITALASHVSSNRVTERSLEFLPSKKSWCFVYPGDSPPSLCRATLEGAWGQPGENVNATTLIVTSALSKSESAGRSFSKEWFLSFFGVVGDSSSASSSKSFRRNPQRQVQPHRNLQWLFDHPATAFWLALNIGVAACYYYFKIPPSSVGQIYNNMLLQGEIWRVFSGATAHYEVWHLGLNMAGLYGLGSQLEGGELSSVGFFFYNLSMIPLTGAVWLGLQYGIRRLRRTLATADNTPTVGYSGVLYAWLAVSALQKDKGEFIKSFGGMILYTVVYSAIPGISMTGHLAGVLVGAAYRVGLLPLVYAQPAILIPSLYLGYCHYVRKIFTPTENDDTANNNRWQLGGGGGDKSQEFHRMLLWCMLGTCILSSAVFGPLSPMFLSYTCTFVYWYYSGKYSSNALTQNILLRGFILASVITDVTDAMTVGAWVATAMAGPLGVATMLLRWCTHGAAVSLACHIVAENENRVAEVFEYTGIFNCLFGWTVLAPAASVGKQLLQRRKKREAELFGGLGQALGGLSRVQDAESRSSEGQGRLLGTTRRVQDVELAEQGEVSCML